MSSSTCCFLSCIQNSQVAGQVVWYSHFFKNFPQFVVIHTVKGFGMVNRAEIDIFLELSCFLMMQWMLAFDLSFLYLFQIQLEHLEASVGILLKAGLENFEHYFTSV